MSSKEERLPRGRSMSRGGKEAGVTVADYAALKLQELHQEGRVKGEQPLLRIDNLQEAAEAPYQFDMAHAVLHRTGCPAIQGDAQTALYGIWEVNHDLLKHACPKCRPGLAQEPKVDANRSSDILFGFLSILDQFGSVLHERGKEYRNSERGRSLEKTMSGVLTGLDQTQRDTLDLMLKSLDRLVQVIEEINTGFEENNNGHNGRGRTKSRSDHGASGQPPDADRFKERTEL